MSYLGLTTPPGLGQGVKTLRVWNEGLRIYCYKSLRPFSVGPNEFGGVRNLSGKPHVTFVCFYLVVLVEGGSQCSKITGEQSLKENLKIDNRKRTCLFVKYISTHYRMFGPSYMDVRHAATGHRSRYFEQLGSRPPGVLTPGRGLVRR
jgi:hypothetical protein